MKVKFDYMNRRINEFKLDPDIGKEEYSRFKQRTSFLEGELDIIIIIYSPSPIIYR